MIALSALRARSVSMTNQEDFSIVTGPETASCGPVFRGLTEALNWLEHGVLLVDRTARVRFASAVASRYLDNGRLKVANGVLRAHSAAETIALHRLIARCTWEDVDAGSAAACRVGEPPLSLLIAPLKAAAANDQDAPAAIVFVLDPEQVKSPTPKQLRDQFGLTAAEAVLALAVAEGQGLRACATHLRISETTARTHLRRVFEKTGTRRQAELVRLIFATRHPVRHPGTGN